MQTDKCYSARTHTLDSPLTVRAIISVLFLECSGGQTLPCIWPSYHLFSSLFGSYQHSPALSQRLRLHDLVQLLLNWPTLIQWISVKRRWETWKPPVDVPHSPPCQVPLAWPHIPFPMIKTGIWLRQIMEDDGVKTNFRSCATSEGTRRQLKRGTLRADHPNRWQQMEAWTFHADCFHSRLWIFEPRRGKSDLMCYIWCIWNGWE